MPPVAVLYSEVMNLSSKCRKTTSEDRIPTQPVINCERTELQVRVTVGGNAGKAAVSDSNAKRTCCLYYGVSYM